MLIAKNSEKKNYFFLYFFLSWFMGGRLQSLHVNFTHISLLLSSCFLKINFSFYFSLAQK